MKLYKGHYHDLLNDIDKEVVMADIKGWIDARLPTARPASAPQTHPLPMVRL